jgi:hypothetical protein
VHCRLYFKVNADNFVRVQALPWRTKATLPVLNLGVGPQPKDFIPFLSCKFLVRKM